MRRAVLILLLSAGCASPTIKLGLGVDWGDPCLLAFPRCDGSCADSGGRVVAGCEVACVAGRALECYGGEPYCQQTVGLDTDVDVPILCVSPTVYGGP